ncbi:unnamed protein product, partial [Rotaria magnacalcarata]
MLKPHDYWEKANKFKQVAIHAARFNIKQQQQLSKRRYDKGRASPIYTLDEIVWIKILSGRSKLDPRYHGPFRIIKRITDVKYIVEHTQDHYQKEEHVNNFIPFYERINLLRAFSDLNTRFNSLLYTDVRSYRVDLRSISKEDFNLLYPTYLPLISNRIIYLRLSDDEDTPCQCVYFQSTGFTLSRFDNLRSLTLSSISCNLFTISIVRVKSQSCDGMSQYDRCSRNSTCACFHLPGASNTGICTDRYALTCSELTPCTRPTNNCRQSDHICVHHPECLDIPVCYPVPNHNKQFCPSIATATTTKLPTEQL